MKPRPLPLPAAAGPKGVSRSGLHAPPRLALTSRPVSPTKLSEVMLRPHLEGRACREPTWPPPGVGRGWFSGASPLGA